MEIYEQNVQKVDFSTGISHEKAKYFGMGSANTSVVAIDVVSRENRPALNPVTSDI